MNAEILLQNAREKAFELFAQEKYDYSQIILLQILKINPECIQSLNLLGMVSYKLNDFISAVKSYKLALKIDPKNHELLNNLALAESELGKFTESIQNLKTALKYQESATLYNNLAVQYKNIGDFDQAIFYFKKAIEIQPTEILWDMLGGCYGEQKNLKDAEECFHKSLAINPNYAPAHTDLANVYLHQKKWSEAWREYDWRYEVFEQLKVWKNLYDHERLWTGQNLDGKRIIVHSEQGAGDNIQFSRYLQYLKNCYVILHCGKELSRLFENIVDEVITDNPIECTKDSLPQYDYQCSIISLPFILGIPQIPSPIIQVDERINLSQFDDFIKIGISWAGNPQHPNDRFRSMYLENFREISQIPKVKLFSLVKDYRKRVYRFNSQVIDLTENSEDIKLVDLSVHLKDFYETAKFINSLDLIVSVDTSVLHLSGSLQKPTYGLIPYNSDWRWGENGDKTDWYPSIKLFRQDHTRNWKKVLDSVYQNIARKSL